MSARRGLGRGFVGLALVACASTAHGAGSAGTAAASFLTVGTGASVLAMGGAIMRGQSMVGSIAITAHASDAEAEAWWAEDPYITGDVWQRVTRYGTRMVGLPYHKLPGGV